MGFGSTILHELPWGAANSCIGAIVLEVEQRHRQHILLCVGADHFGQAFNQAEIDILLILYVLNTYALLLRSQCKKYSTVPS